MSGVDAPAPWRIAFDNARDPYTARNALGITTSGGGGSGAPDDAEYITAAPDPDLTSERVLTNTATVTWDFTTLGQAKANTAGGGGNVSNVGTPVINTFAQWTDATHIQGITGTTLLTQIQGQPRDATLDAFSAYNTNGLLTQTAADTFTGRTITGPAAGIAVSNGSGVAGNPTLALADDLAALEALTGTNTIYYRSGTSAWTAVNISTGLSFTGGNLTATGGGGDVFLANSNPFTGALNTFVGADVVFGHTAALDGLARVEVHGTSNATAGASVARWSADAVGPEIKLRKSRGAAAGTHTVVNSGDTLGRVSFSGSTGGTFQAGGPAVAGICNSSPFGTNTPGFIQIEATTIGGAVVTAATFKDTGCDLLGVVNGSSAAAGIVGEYIEATGGSIGVAAAATTALVSMAFSAGDWDVWGVAKFSSATLGSRFLLSHSNSTGLDSTIGRMVSNVVTPDGDSYTATPIVRQNLTATTTLYMVAFNTAAGTVNASKIMGRRVR